MSLCVGGGGSFLIAYKQTSRGSGVILTRVHPAYTHNYTYTPGIHTHTLTHTHTHDPLLLIVIEYRKTTRTYNVYTRQHCSCVCARPSMTCMCGAVIETHEARSTHALVLVGPLTCRGPWPAWHGSSEGQVACCTMREVESHAVRPWEGQGIHVSQWQCSLLR